MFTVCVKCHAFIINCTSHTHIGWATTSYPAHHLSDLEFADEIARFTDHMTSPTPDYSAKYARCHGVITSPTRRSPSPCGNGTSDCHRIWCAKTKWLTEFYGNQGLLKMKTTPRDTNVRDTELDTGPILSKKQCQRDKIGNNHYGTAINRGHWK